jgi:hypothetical protein
MRPLSAAALGALVLATAFAGAPARAADDGKPLDSQIFGAILEGIGLERDKPAIDYHERPPLVIPPTKTLPPPERGDAIAKNPAWPKDPDVGRAREAAKQARVSVSQQDIDQWGRPLSPNQMAPGPKPTGRVSRYDQNTKPFDESHPQLMPSELGYNGGVFGLFKGKDEKAAHFTGEPQRAELTDPPAGYQTPSPEQPYGPGRAEGPKAENYLETHGTQVK